ncbi:multidrug effflux MFS transporter [Pseudonocardia lacus]|uniref:multidrug effflux MFS transporter n=1 Tax=Pseudonocardia lacus TaxID=2835865 RepID=UPI001BDD09F2|nr:multidrug effflux MFS transporter [Pseudonocardia lacus]
MIVTSAVRVRTGRVLALGALSSFGPLSLDLYLAGLPAMAADLRTTVSATQLSLSVCMLGLALGQLFAGPITDRLGRRRMLIGGVAMFAVTSALCAVAPSIEVLLPLRLLGGLGGGAGIVVARSMARDLYDGPVLARVLAQLMLVSGMAPVVGPVLAGQVLRFTDWRGLFAVLAGIGLLLLVTALTQGETLPVERRRAVGARDTARVLWSLLRDRTFLPPTLVLGLGLCAMFTYLAMASFVLQQVYGLDPQTFALVSAVNALGIVAFSQASVLLVPRVGSVNLLTAGVGLACLAAAAMAVGVVVSGSVVALLVPLFVLVGCTGLIGPNATALALDRHGDLAGSASALLGLSHFGFAAVVPPLASLNGVSPLVMAITAVGTTATAATVHLLAVRPRAAAASPQVLGRAAVDPWGGPVAAVPAPSTWREPVPEAVPDPADFDYQPHARWRRLEWAPVVDARPDGATGTGWLQPVGRASRTAHELAAERQREEHLRRLRWELDRRREWQRIAEHARQARIAIEETERLAAADTDPTGRSAR